MGEIGKRADIGNFECRISNDLRVKHFRGGRNRLFESAHIRGIDQRRLDSHLRECLGEQRMRTTVDRIACDDMIAVRAEL